MEQKAIVAIDGAIQKYMSENGKTVTDIAAYLGITTNTLSNKRNGRTDWKWSEIMALSSLLGVTSDELAGLASA